MALYKHGQFLTQVADPAFDQKHHPGTAAMRLQLQADMYCLRKTIASTAR